MKAKANIKWGSRKQSLVALCVLTSGWLVLAVNAEDKQSKKTPHSQPADSQSVLSAVKPKSRQADQAPLPIFYPALTKRELKIEAALNTDSECDFSETPLSEAMKLLADRHGLSMLLVEKKMKEEGLSLDDPVNLSVKGIALKHVLTLILKPIGLTYLVDQEVLKITTIVDAEEIFQTRVYPVGDFGDTLEIYFDLGSTITHVSQGLWYEGIYYDPFPGVQIGVGADGGLGDGSGFFQVVGDQNFQNLLNLRNGTFISNGFKNTKDAGNISLVRRSESLVIRQTYHVHNEIVELLTSLRRIRGLD